jgi:hypothetical protein
MRSCACRAEARSSLRWPPRRTATASANVSVAQKYLAPTCAAPPSTVLADLEICLQVTDCKTLCPKSSPGSTLQPGGCGFRNLSTGYRRNRLRCATSPSSPVAINSTEAGSGVWATSTVTSELFVTVGFSRRRIKIDLNRWKTSKQRIEIRVLHIQRKDVAAGGVSGNYRNIQRD